MRKKFLIVSVVFVVIMSFITVVTAINAGENGIDRKLGCKILPKSELSKMNKFSASKVSKQPSKIDLTSKMPKSGDQGSQGSCSAWAVAYSYRSYQNGLKTKKLPNSSKRVFSPSYVYNQINGGVDNGSYISDAMDLLQKQGVCKLYDMKYDQFDYLTQPSLEQIQLASKYKIKNWSYILGGDLKSVKSHLAKKDPVVIGIPVYLDFVQEVDGNMNYNKMDGPCYGYHAVTIVGYNDKTKKLKFQNSWGKEYGKNGFGYISYDLLNNNFDNQFNYCSFFMK